MKDVYTEQEIIDAFKKVYFALDLDEGDDIFQLFRKFIEDEDRKNLTQALCIILKCGFEDTFKNLTGKTIKMDINLKDGTP